MGSWVFEDPQKRLSLKNTSRSRDDRSPEEIPEEEFTIDKNQIDKVVKKKSITDINKPMNAYEMRENMPIKAKSSNSSRMQVVEKEKQENEGNLDGNQEALDQKPKFGFLKRRQNVSKPKITKKNKLEVFIEKQS